MLSIACLSQKGGVGKSTLARLIATIYARAGWAVKIADFNVKQTTSVDWASRRLAQGLQPRVPAEAFAQLRQVPRSTVGIDLVVYDGKPDADATTLEIARAATMIVMPVGVTLDDLVPQLRFAEELVGRGVERSRAMFVINKSVDSDLALREARDYVGGAWRLAHADIPVRTGYQVAQNAGRAICETTFPTLNERAEATAREIIDRMTSLIDLEKEPAS